MPTETECKRCARQSEYSGSMAALGVWKALTLVAAIVTVTEEDALAVRRAIAELHAARTYLGESNRRAELLIGHHGPQRAFEEFDPQMRLVA